MDASKWVACEDPLDLLFWLGAHQHSSVPRRLSDRKLWLTFLAIERAWHGTTCSPQVVRSLVAAEDDAEDGDLEPHVLGGLRTHYQLSACPAQNLERSIRTHKDPADQPLWADIVKDVAGNPYTRDRLSHRGRSREEVLAARNSVYGCCNRCADNQGCDCLERATTNPAWLTPTVRGLAEGVYPIRALCARCGGQGVLWNRPAPDAWNCTVCVPCKGIGVLTHRTLDGEQMSVLADAMEEAGCDTHDVMGHLRDPGPHYCGCWALDYVLGKE